MPEGLKQLTKVTLALVAMAAAGCSSNSGPHEGGVWVPPTPKNGSIIATDELNLAFEAYPEKGYPPIKEVDFTASWQSQNWYKVCVNEKPSHYDIYTCKLKLKGIVPPGTVITFGPNVINQEGEENDSPNGTHNYTYEPDAK